MGKMTLISTRASLLTAAETRGESNSRVNEATTQRSASGESS
jgi:hypothetical protein